MKKTYVKVVAETDERGKKTPHTIVWEENAFNIDKVVDCKDCASMKVGGFGQRYTIKIGNNQTYLFFEDNKWFVEEKKR